MSSSPNTLVVVPAFNEEQTIQPVISSLLRVGCRNVLVVDDASSDNTAKLAAEAGAKVLRLCYQLGAWRASQAGIRYAVAHDYDEVITFDADGQHLPDSIATLQSQRGTADLIIGSCLARGSFLRKAAWRIFRLLSGIEVADFTSGLRLYGVRSIELLAQESASVPEYQDLGVLMLIKSSGLSIKEVPVQMSARSVGISRIFNSWGAVAYYLSYTICICLAKLGHTPHASLSDLSVARGRTSR